MRVSLSYDYLYSLGKAKELETITKKKYSIKNYLLIHEIILKLVNHFL